MGIPQNAEYLSREEDSNLRPSGHEPDKLPLLHPAIILITLWLRGDSNPHPEH